jgi:hypothetical protein
VYNTLQTVFNFDKSIATFNKKRLMWTTLSQIIMEIEIAIFLQIDIYHFIVNITKRKVIQNIVKWLLQHWSPIWTLSAGHEHLYVAVLQTNSSSQSIVEASQGAHIDVPTVNEVFVLKFDCKTSSRPHWGHFYYNYIFQNLQ